LGKGGEEPEDESPKEEGEKLVGVVYQNRLRAFDRRAIFSWRLRNPGFSVTEKKDSKVLDCGRGERV